MWKTQQKNAFFQSPNCEWFFSYKQFLCLHFVCVFLFIYSFAHNSLFVRCTSNVFSSSYFFAGKSNWHTSQFGRCRHFQRNSIEFNSDKNHTSPIYSDFIWFQRVDASFSTYFLHNGRMFASSNTSKTNKKKRKIEYRTRQRKKTIKTKKICEKEEKNNDIAVWCDFLFVHNFYWCIEPERKSDIDLIGWRCRYIWSPAVQLLDCWLSPVNARDCCLMRFSFHLVQYCRRRPSLSRRARLWPSLFLLILAHSLRMLQMRTAAVWINAHSPMAIKHRLDKHCEAATVCVCRTPLSRMMLMR